MFIYTNRKELSRTFCSVHRLAHAKTAVRAFKMTATFNCTRIRRRDPAPPMGSIAGKSWYLLISPSPPPATLAIIAGLARFNSRGGSCHEVLSGDPDSDFVRCHVGRDVSERPHGYGSPIGYFTAQLLKRDLSRLRTSLTRGRWAGHRGLPTGVRSFSQRIWPEGSTSGGSLQRGAGLSNSHVRRPPS